MIIWFIIGILLITVGGGLIGFALTDYDLWLVGLWGTIIAIIGIAVVSGLYVNLQDREESLKKEAEKSYYYDGFKVDAESINLSEFTIIYDSEKNIYFLTKNPK